MIFGTQLGFRFMNENLQQQKIAKRAQGPSKSNSVSLIQVDVLRPKNIEPILGLLAKFQQDP